MPTRLFSYRLLLGVLFSFIHFSAQTQPIRYVKPTASGLGNGSSWANASANLQAMINASASGNQVWVAAGTYKPTTGTDRTISFAMKSGVTIYGGFAPMGTPTLAQRNPDSFTTILSGDIGTANSTSDNSYHLFYNPSGLTTTAVLDGFVLRDGNANGSGANRDVGAGIYNSSSSPTVTNCTFLTNFASSGGGAIWLDASSGGASNMIITDCSFSNNTAAQGGAIASGSSNPTITGCSFQNNTAPFLRTSSEWGGAISNNGGSSTIKNCTFVNNASIEAGAIRNQGSNSTISNCSFQGNIADSGGGIYNAGSNPIITNCTFENNTVTIRGGAVANAGSSPTLTYCSFIANTASSGGAINNSGGSSPKLTECLFRNNVGKFGGALRIDNGNTSLTNCSFQGNTTNNQGGVIYNGAATISLTNGVAFGNGDANSIFSETGTVSASYCLFDNTVTGYTGSNNLTTRFSPFVSSTDSRLNGCAPAINTGLNSATGLSGIITDLAGNPRRYNSGIVDMGAYEYQGTSTTITTTNPAVTTATVGSSFSQNFAVSGGSGPYSFSLVSGSLPTGLTLAPTGVLSGTPTQNGTYSFVVRATDANGCIDLSATYTLVVNPSVPTISGFTTLDNTICLGSPITFTATVGNVTGSYSYTLTNGSSTTLGTTASTAFSLNRIASGTGAQSFTLIVGDNGQRQTATTSVTINSLPTASLTNDGPLTCGEPSVTLTASGGNSYTFTNGSGTVLGTSGPTTTRQVTTAGTYSVRVANTSGCISTTTTTVTGNTTPPTANILTPTSATLTCTTTALSLTATGGGTYRWNNNATTAVRAITTAGTYSVTVTSPNGCTATDSQVISLNNTLAATAGASSSSALIGNVVSLSASGGSAYLWSAPTGASLSSPATSSVVSASLITSGIKT
jgi:predicted outer membrane repeat protein